MCSPPPSVVMYTPPAIFGRDIGNGVGVSKPGRDSVPEMAVRDCWTRAQRTRPGSTLTIAVGHLYDNELWPAVAPRVLQIASLVSCSPAAVDGKKSRFAP
jgi:hypothetical protein